jgi:hypothetical protein
LEPLAQEDLSRNFGKGRGPGPADLAGCLSGMLREGMMGQVKQKTFFLPALLAGSSRREKEGINA